MVAIQKINEQSETSIFEIVSNGQLWQFGKLKSNLFNKNNKAYTIYNLDNLLGAINYIFSQCSQSKLNSE